MDDLSSKSMREQFNDAKELNKQLKEQMAAAQNKYMTQAENRLGYQRPMGRILSMLNNTDNFDLIDASFAIGEACENDARAMMEALEQEWGATGSNALDQSESSHGDAKSQLEDNLNKYCDKNAQLKLDLKNRKAYYEAEVEIQAKYEKALEKLVEMLKVKCEDQSLLAKIEKVAQQTQLTV